MNWKSIMTGVLTAIIALAVWELAVKKLVLKNSFEDYFDEPTGDCLGVDKYMRKLA